MGIISLKQLVSSTNYMQWSRKNFNETNQNYATIDEVHISLLLVITARR